MGVEAVATLVIDVSVEIILRGAGRAAVPKDAEGCFDEGLG